MKNEHFLLMKQNKNNQDQVSDFSEYKNKRKSENFELQNYEKFRPKKNKNIELSTQIYLKGAEKNLKSLLSSFLKDIEQEKQESNLLNNNSKNKFSQELNIFQKKKRKRNSIFYTNQNLGKMMGQDLKSESSKKIINKNSQNNNKIINININREKNNKTTISVKNSKKKDVNNINPLNNNNYNSSKEKIVLFKKNSKNKLKLLNSNIENDFQMRRSLHNRKNILNDSNISNEPSSKMEENDNLKSGINGSIIEKIFSSKKNILRGRKNSLNDSSHNTLINNDDSQNKEENSQKTKIFNFQNNNLSNIPILSGRREKLPKNKSIKKGRNFNQSELNGYESKISSQNNINENLNINNIQKNLFKESFNNNITNEESDKIMNKFTREENKINIVNNNIPLLRRNSPDSINEKSSPSSLIQKNKYDKELNLLKIANSNCSEEEKKFSKSLRHNLQFKSIQKMLKNSILLRPEDLKIHTKKNTKNNNPSSSSSVNLNYKKEKIKNKSIINIIKDKEGNLKKINKNNIKSENKSYENNKEIAIKEKKEELKNIISEKKIIIKKENEIKENSLK